MRTGCILLLLLFAGCSPSSKRQFEIHKEWANQTCLELMTASGFDYLTNHTEMFAMYVRSNALICPLTHSSEENVIFVNGGSAYLVDVPIIIDPPENHKGRYTFVLLSGSWLELPAEDTQRLITDPLLLATNRNEIEKAEIRSRLRLDIPPSLQKKYSLPK